MDAVADMELGHLVDYCITYNKTHDYERAAKGKKTKARSGAGVSAEPSRRNAQQSDWDAFWG